MTRTVFITKNVGLKIPYSEFKNPCHKCEKKPGTDKERKDLCAASHHCWNQDGEYMWIDVGTHAEFDRIQEEFDLIKANLNYLEVNK